MTPHVLFERLHLGRWQNVKKTIVYKSRVGRRSARLGRHQRQCSRACHRKRHIREACLEIKNNDSGLLDANGFEQKYEVPFEILTRRFEIAQRKGFDV